MTLLQKFWAWYEKHYTLNVAIAAGLFVLQIIHLYWLTTDVVFLRLFGESFFSPSTFYRYLIIVVDYTEIPALLSTTVLYANELRKQFRFKPALFIFLINSQWLHLFWITDEFVVHQLVEGRTDTVLPLWLAWVAIFIDYLELPVIVDTIAKFTARLRQGKVSAAFEELKEH